MDREQIIEQVRYWSYVTWQGMLKHCPEERNRLKGFLGGLGIHPYNQPDNKPPWKPANE